LSDKDIFYLRTHYCKIGIVLKMSKNVNQNIVLEAIEMLIKKYEHDTGIGILISNYSIRTQLEFNYFLM